MTDTFKVGGQVTVDSNKHGGVWTIDKINQATLVLSRPGSRGLRAHKSLCAPAIHGATPTQMVPLRALPYQVPGSVLRYNGPTSKQMTTGALVIVIRDKEDKVNVTLPGGCDGRYWRMPPRHLSEVRNVRLTADG